MRTEEQMDKRRKQNREWRREHPEYARRWNEANKERIKQTQKEWREKNKEKLHKKYYPSIREYKLKHRDEYIAYNRKRYSERRKMVFDHYGNKCACCGETQPTMLNIDHINNDGSKHRKEIGNKILYDWLVENGLPDGFQTLCYNCNIAKARLGYCPHKIQYQGEKIIEAHIAS
jgi:hypothetical protein